MVDLPLWNRGPALILHLAAHNFQHNYPSNCAPPLSLANLWRPWPCRQPHSVTEREGEKRRRLRTVPRTPLPLWIIMHKQSERTEDILTWNRMRNKEKGMDRKEVIGPNFENNYLQKGVFGLWEIRSAQDSPSESWEHSCFQAQDSGDIRKVKGLLSAALSCPGT